MSSAAHKLIDYLAARNSCVGIRERIELDRAIFGGDTPARIAADLGLAVRTVQRRRSELRAQGWRISEPEERDLDHSWADTMWAMRLVSARRRP